MHTVRNSSLQGCGSTPIGIAAGLVILLAASLPCGAQSVSLFSATVPATPVAATARAITLGLKFWSSQPGTISAVSFYRAAKSPYGYVARIYSADGSQILGSAAIGTESGPIPGWQHVFFAAPVAISANTSYVAAYYTPSGRYAYTPRGLYAAAKVGPLTASGSSSVGGNGVYSYGLAFPKHTYQSTNYFVDVVFLPAAPAPYLSVALSPSNPTISSAAPLGAYVATISASWSNGTPFTGTLSFGLPYSSDSATFAISGNELVVNPSGPGVSSDGNTLQNITIVATQ